MRVDYMHRSNKMEKSEKNTLVLKADHAEGLNTYKVFQTQKSNEREETFKNQCKGGTRDHTFERENAYCGRYEFTKNMNNKIGFLQSKK